MGRLEKMRQLVLAVLVCLGWLQRAHGLGAGARIPDPTNFFKEGGMNYFKGTHLRFSMTVSILSMRDGTYLGPRYNEQTEDYELFGDFPNRTRETLFEIIDAGTMTNLPKNTRPRGPDLGDTNTQKFYLRFNETLVLRSIEINKYVGTVGVNFQAEPHFINNVSVAERFRVLPVFDNYKPFLNPIARNENLEDESTYVKNGTKIHMLNNQLNYMQKIKNFPKIVLHGPGTKKLGMWKDSDIFQLIMLKQFEE